MAARNLLHYNKLEEFKNWLTAKGVEFRDGRGEYEVLQVWQPPHWVPIFRRLTGDHLTVQGRMVALVGDFLKEKKLGRPLSDFPRKVFVHRYRLGHESRRRVLRRAVANGQAVILREERDGWLYGVTNDLHIPGDGPHARHSHPLQQRPQPAEVQPQGGGSEDPPW